MKKLKEGIFLIIVGNLLYLAHNLFGGNLINGNFGDFSNGLLVGLSVGCNLVGIILTIGYISKNKEE